MGMRQFMKNSKKLRLQLIKIFSVSLMLIILISPGVNAQVSTDEVAKSINI